jgi:hypothetical protein
VSKIIVFDLIGKNAISMKNGEKVYEQIHPLLMKGEKIELEFERVSLFASPFFNASIGLLLKDMTLEGLQGQLTFGGLSEVGRELLNHVIGNAISYYANKKSVSKGIDESSSDGDSNA